LGWAGRPEAIADWLAMTSYELAAACVLLLLLLLRCDWSKSLDADWCIWIAF